MMHCVIDGVQCTMCCRVLRLNLWMGNPYSQVKLFKEWQRHIGKGGKPWDGCGGDTLYIITNMRPVKKRIAKKLNPNLFVGAKHIEWGRRSIHLVCRNLTDNGCGDYENRPRMCSDYPHYGRSLGEFAKLLSVGGDAPYHPNCTYFEEGRSIDITMIDCDVEGSDVCVDRKFQDCTLEGSSV